ncbi:MAG: efflux RND transporter permease subunit [Pirellulales bacterium]
MDSFCVSLSRSSNGPSTSVSRIRIRFSAPSHRGRRQPVSYTTRPRLFTAVQRGERAGQCPVAGGDIVGNLGSIWHGWSIKKSPVSAASPLSVAGPAGRNSTNTPKGSNVSEIIISFDPHLDRSREEILEEIREELTQVPGVVISAEQPLAHLISHMLSGVKAQVGIKLYGDDLNILRQKANEMKAAIPASRV